MNLPVNPYYLAEADLMKLVAQIEEQGDADWRLFLSYADEFQVEPGDILVRQFDKDRIVYILTAGELEVRMAPNADSEPKKIATIEPVAIIGEQSFLDGQTRSATVAAATDATVYRFTLDAFDKLRAEEPELACAFLFDVARALSLRSRPLQAEQAKH